VTRAGPRDGAIPRSSFGALARSLLIGHIAFFTLVDLFATQAILPTRLGLMRAVELLAASPDRVTGTMQRSYTAKRR
jgi:hypothetical protein